MPYIPSEDILSEYDSFQPSDKEMDKYEQKPVNLLQKYKEYMQGLGSGLLQSGAEAGRHLAMTPSYLYETATGKPLYDLVKPDVLGFAPESESGQTGKEIGQTTGQLASLMYPGSLVGRGARALSRHHPLTKNQMSRQFQAPMAAAERAGIPMGRLSYNQLMDLEELLSHPALQHRGSAGRSMTPTGINSLIQGVAERDFPAGFSAQSLLGDLERAIPKGGEQYLARQRVRPLKEQILDSLYSGLEEGGLPEEAQNLRQAREGARRYFQTQKGLKKVGKAIGKPLSLAAIVKAVLSGSKKLP